MTLWKIERKYNILVFNLFSFIILVLIFYYLTFNFFNRKNFKVSLHHNFYKFYNIIYNIILFV